MSVFRFRFAFTLIELMVVLGLLATIALFPAIEGLSAIERSLWYEDAERIEYALRTARAAAQANRCYIEPCSKPKVQGVHVDSRTVSLFEGLEFSGTNVYTSYSLSGRAEVTPATVLFSSGSGAAQERVLHIRYPSGTGRSITVNAAGMIDHRFEP